MKNNTSLYDFITNEGRDEVYKDYPPMDIEKVNLEEYAREKRLLCKKKGHVSMRIMAPLWDKLYWEQGKKLKGYDLIQCIRCREILDTVQF